MTVYNEEKFVAQAIKACRPYVDEIVIVEGAYQETVACGAAPRSTDDTKMKITEAVEGFGAAEIKNGDWSCKLDEGQVYYLEANEKTDKDQRNVGLEKIKNLNPDGNSWLLIIDGDEVYTEENFVMIRNFMKTMEKLKAYAAYFKSLTFVGDLDHYTEQEFPRLFKVTPSCQFVDDNYMTWPDEKKTWAYPHVIKVPYLKYHHYAFCKGVERGRLKKQWWETRFGKEPENKFEYDWYFEDDGSVWSPKHKISKYTGKHPVAMQEYYKNQKVEK